MISVAALLICPVCQAEFSWFGRTIHRPDGITDVLCPRRHRHKVLTSALWKDAAS